MEKDFKTKTRDLIINNSDEFKAILTEVCNPFNRVNLIYSFVPKIIYNNVPYSDIYEYSTGYSDQIKLDIDEKPENINIEHIIPVSFFIDQSNKELKKDIFLYETYRIIYHYAQTGKFNVETIDHKLKETISSCKRKKINNREKIKAKESYDKLLSNYHQLQIYYDHYRYNIKNFKKFYPQIEYFTYILNNGITIDSDIESIQEQLDNILHGTKKDKRKNKQSCKKLQKEITKREGIKKKLAFYQFESRLTENDKIKQILKMCQKLKEYTDIFHEYAADVRQFYKMLEIAKDDLDSSLEDLDIHKTNLERNLLEVVVSLLEDNPDVKNNHEFMRLLIKKIKELDRKYRNDIYNYELMKSDLHHLFASSSNVNNSRSNFMYDEIEENDHAKIVADRNGVHDNDIKNICSNNLSKFNPIDTSKGDIARAICYFDTTYPGYNIVKHCHNSTTDSTAIELETMVVWNFHDNSTYREKKRNYQVYMIQNNYNPYTHYPDLLPMVYYDKLEDRFTRKFGNVDVTWSKKHFNERINSFIDHMWDIIIGFHESQQLGLNS
jgi:hypothetical protein